MKLFNFLSWFVVVSMMALILLVGYWLLYPYNPVDFKNPVYPIVNQDKIATQGGILKYQIDYCKYVKQIPEISKKYVDGIIYDTPGSRGIVIEGCHTQIVDNVVPETLIPGKYYMQVVVDYEVNPIRHIIYHNRTEEFTILPKE